MDRQAILARLNLYAVLQNLEELVRLDPESAALARGWNLSLQLTVRGGPEAYLEFLGGACRHMRGHHAAATIRLLFTSSAHLNHMFEGTGIPIPLRGLTRLGWLRKDFSQLTDRLTHYLRPGKDRPSDEAYERLRTRLMLQTAVYAAGELAECEPLCRQIAGRIADGVLAIDVLPEGPRMQVAFAGGRLRVEKTAAEHATARMVFCSPEVAGNVLERRIETLRAVAEGQMVIGGWLPMLDDFGLILDRVEPYLA